MSVGSSTAGSGWSDSAICSQRVSESPSSRSGSIGITPVGGHWASCSGGRWCSVTLSSSRSVRSATRYSSRPSLARQTASGVDWGSPGSADCRRVISTFRRSQNDRKPAIRGRSRGSSDVSGEAALCRAIWILSARPSTRVERSGLVVPSVGGAGWADPNANATAWSENSMSSVRMKSRPTSCSSSGPVIVTRPSSDPPSSRPILPPLVIDLKSPSNFSRAASHCTM